MGRRRYRYRRRKQAPTQAAGGSPGLPDACVPVPVPTPTRAPTQTRAPDPRALVACPAPSPANVLWQYVDHRGVTQASSRHFCYALLSDGHAPRTYVGYTVDPARRLRQHNGELAGGARRTTARRWHQLFVVAVQGDARVAAAFGAHQALSLEWHLKRRPRESRAGDATVRGAALRIAALRSAIGLHKFDAFAGALVVYVHEPYVNDVWVALYDTDALVLPLGELHAE